MKTEKERKREMYKSIMLNRTTWDDICGDGEGCFRTYFSSYAVDNGWDKWYVSEGLATLVDTIPAEGDDGDGEYYVFKKTEKFYALVNFKKL